MRQITWAMTALLVALAAAAPAGRASGTNFDRVFPLPSGGEFLLRNVNGTVQIEGWDRQAVEIQATKKAEHGAQGLALVKIDIQNDDNHVAVQTLYPQGDGVEVTVAYHIRVPYHVLLASVATVNGSVLVSRVEGYGMLSTVNGDVQVLDSAGRFSARTTNGDVHMELKQLPAGMPMDVSTVNGSVLLELPADAAADLQVQSLNGAFLSEIPLRTQAAEGSRMMHGRLGAGGSPMKLSSMNGNVRIVVDKPVV